MGLSQLILFDENYEEIASAELIGHARFGPYNYYADGSWSREFTIVPIPEPASAAAVLLPLLVYASYLRRRTRRA